MSGVRALLLCAIAAGAPTAWSSDAQPIATRNHRPMSLIFLRMPFAGEPLGVKERRLELDLTLANDFRRRLEVDEDSEVDRLGVTYRWGLGRSREVWVDGALLSRSGGFLDPIIDAWHRAVLGWSDRARITTERGRSVVALEGEYSFGSATGVGDVTVGITQRLGPRFAVSAAVKLPTGDAGRLLGSGAVDAGVSVEGWTPLGRGWSLYGQIGLIAQGNATRVSGSRSLVDQEAMALVWAKNSKDTWIAQWQSERSPTVTGVSAVDATHRLITFGYRRKLSEYATLELFFSEDRDLFNGRFPEGANIGPDFTAGARYTWKF